MHNTLAAPTYSITPDTPAGRASVTLAEVVLLAAWRNKQYDVIVGLINAESTLQLAWYDPAFEQPSESDE